MLPSIPPRMPVIRRLLFALLGLWVAFFLIGGWAESRISSQETRDAIGHHVLVPLIGSCILMFMLGGAWFIHAFFYTLLARLPESKRPALYTMREHLVTHLIWAWWGCWITITLYLLAVGVPMP